MTVEEFLKTLPEGERDEMASFYYSRVPYRFTLRDTTDENTSRPARSLPVSSAAHSV